jgi:hypothetical protein
MNRDLIDSEEPATPDRRLFLESLGKWSGAAIAAAVVTGWLVSAPQAEAGLWINRRGPRRGGWLNRPFVGGGNWFNRRPGGWINRMRPRGGWINRFPGTGVWVNRF